MPLLCVLAGGCATEQGKPTEEVTKARTVIQRADKGDAQRYAAADLQRAHDELSSAERRPTTANTTTHDASPRMPRTSPPRAATAARLRTPCKRSDMEHQAPAGPPSVTLVLTGMRHATAVIQHHHRDTGCVKLPSDLSYNTARRAPTLVL